MQKKLIMTLLVLSFMQSIAQQKAIVDSISFYGMLRVHLATFDGKVQLQENAPRFGTFLNRKINDDWTVNAKLEFGLHLINGISFNNDANSSAEFVSQPLKKAEVFTARLGYVTIAHKNLGSLSIGKQWGVYYDIGGYTDNFSLFGGSANGIYAGGTDGGWKGTGRADNSIQYRNQWGGFQLGLQTQLFGDYSSYGISGQYSFRNGLTIGTSYNNSEVPDLVKQFVQGIGNQSSNFIAGIKYSKNKWYAAATFSINDDALNTISQDEAIGYSTNGYELSLGYRLQERWSFEAGFNYLDPDDVLETTTNYKLAHFIFGANYFITPDTRVYLMTRISDSQLALDKNEYNVLALGFRYNFDFGKSFR